MGIASFRRNAADVSSLYNVWEADVSVGFMKWRLSRLTVHFSRGRTPGLISYRENNETSFYNEVLFTY